MAVYSIHIIICTWLHLQDRWYLWMLFHTLIVNNIKRRNSVTVIDLDTVWSQIDLLVMLGCASLNRIGRSRLWWLVLGRVIRVTHDLRATISNTRLIWLWTDFHLYQIIVNLGTKDFSYRFVISEAQIEAYKEDCNTTNDDHHLKHQISFLILLVDLMRFWATIRRPYVSRLFWI